MRSVDDARTRWQKTTKYLDHIDSLKKAVKTDTDENPCNSGLRSVCWKSFLLFQHTNLEQWPQALADSRSAYAALKAHLLRFVQNPDELGASLDPLDDDKNSPWNTIRQDEEIRVEIFQDVERCMPEEPYFREPGTQRMLLDVLFVFCKINQDVGYRQGMHELLAPLLWVVDQDSIDATHTSISDKVMGTTLDKTYVEHDSFTLLSLVMRSAKSFYELGEPEKRAGNLAISSSAPQQGSPIIERSRRIHEEYLASVDPELAAHLTQIEVLPQIFLIRWVRLLFGREFPFEQLLSVWDVLFAEDPGLDSIDLVCVAMLLRIRWELLDSTYSFALMLLLKYPSPSPLYGPSTFIEDAIFLRDNLHTTGGSTLITRYSGKTPQSFTPSRTSTPSDVTTSPRQRLLPRRSPLPSAASFLQQQGGVGELFQGAARGLLDQGERLGINKAVRDAVEEAKKNMQTLQTSRSSSYVGRTPSSSSRWSLDNGRRVESPQSLTNAFNSRNRQLAGMLDKAMSELRIASNTKTNDKDVYVKAIELAVAKVEFVKVYLEDSTMPLPSEPTRVHPPDPLHNALPMASGTVEDKTSVEDVANTVGDITTSDPKTKQPNTEIFERSQNDVHSPSKDDVAQPPEIPALVVPEEQKGLSKTPASEKGDTPRPSAPLPTRSSIAQSNFAWMLEPGESSSPISKSPPKSSSPFLKSARKPTSGASREKAAFLFGEESDDILDKKSARNKQADTALRDFNMGIIRSYKDATGGS